MSRRRGSAHGTSRVRRREVLASEPAPGDRGTHLREWARELAADTALQTQAIDVEQLASMVTATWGRENVYERPPFETPPEVELVSHLERVGDSGALLMLRGLAHVAGGAVSPAARAAADRLVSAGVAGPSWLGEIGAATPTGAWIVRDRDFDDGTMLFAEFDMAGGPRHTVAVYADHNLGGMAKMIGLTRSMAETVPAGSELGRPEAMSLAEMGARLRAALRATHPLRRRKDGHEDAGRYALACARADALPGGFSLPARSGVTPDDRFDLLAAFLDAHEGSTYRDDIDAQTAVAMAIDFCAERDGRPLRWSPVAVEQFMCCWLPEQAADERDVLERMPDVLATWIAYAGRLRGLPTDKVAETVAAIEEWTSEMFAEAEAWAGDAGAARA